MTKQSITLAQLSDPHLSPDPFFAVNTMESFLACLKDASTQMDALLLTGDLVQRGGATMYAWLENVLNESCTPWHALCGNHDSEAAPDTLSGNLTTNRAVQLGGWQLILLNSSVPGMPAGRLSSEALAWLDHRLKADPAAPTLVALHHPPLEVGSKVMDPMGLLNASEFWSVLSKWPQVKAVVHGHAHQEFDQQYQGIRVLGAPATSVQFQPGASDFGVTDEMPGFRLIELFVDGQLETVVKRHNNVRFIPDRDASGYGS